MSLRGLWQDISRVLLERRGIRIRYFVERYYMLSCRWGGMGIRRFREMAVAFRFKLWWSLLSCRIFPWQLHSSACLSYDSPVWCCLCRIWPFMHDYICWSSGEGKISFTFGLGIALSGACVSREMILPLPRPLHHIGMTMHRMIICCMIWV